MKWFWVHPLSGGAVLLALNNVCYLLFTTEDGTELHLTNGEVIKVFEKESEFLYIFQN